MPENLETVTLGPELAGRRLDAALAARFPERSRSFLAKLIRDGAVLVRGRVAKPAFEVRGGEQVEIDWPAPEMPAALPEPIPLRVLYEDQDLIVLDKPAGLAVHPGAGRSGGTLVNALLAHCADLSGVHGALRPGIVHRLDLETSGVMVAAKNDRAHLALQEQFLARTVRKEYLALCHGAPEADEFECAGRLGRHPTRRTEMTVLRRAGEGREAYTSLQVLARFRRRPGATKRESPRFISLLLARPRTGRTHQIRVHLAHAGHPVLCDGVYGREVSLPELGLHRHALHAWRLSFAHPRSGERLRFQADAPEDLLEALTRLGGAWPA
jgi:23S rRNA pseudouridine1911/1915/1917 synthase